MSASATGSARGTILAGIRKGLDRGPLDGAARNALDARLANPTPNLIPERANVSHDEQLDLFEHFAQEVKATVVRVTNPAAVPGAVAEYLAGHNLPSDLVMAPDPELDSYPWAGRPTLRIKRGKTEGDDLVGVTSAFAGIAETGTLMALSGPESPTTLNFLPDNHIVVLPASKVIGNYEEGWTALRTRGAMPRAVNFITGPSRTADIEQKIQLGAHGPRRLHIILVTNGGDGS